MTTRPTPTLALAAIHVHDLDRALRFYRDVLGLPLEQVVPEVGWADFKLANGATIGIHSDPNEEGARAPGGSTGLYLGMADVDAAVDDIARRGGDVVAKPVDYPYGRVAEVADPDGNLLMLIQAP